MTSSINPSNISGTYPIAGQDNDSQGFRDNFTNIKNNLTVAQLEITTLQATGVTSQIAITNLNSGIAALHYVVPLNLSTTQLLSATPVVVLNPLTTLVTASVVMPVNPVNGATITIGVSNVITTFVMSGATINSPLTTAVAGTFGKWVYSTAGVAWFRIG